MRPTGRLFSTSLLKFKEPEEQRFSNVPVRETPVGETSIDLAPQTPNIPLMVTNLNTLAVPDRPIQNSQERLNHAIAERLEGESRESYEQATSLHHHHTQTVESDRVTHPERSVTYDAVRGLTQDHYIRVVNTIIRESAISLSAEEELERSNLAEAALVETRARDSLIDRYADTSTEMQD